MARVATFLSAVLLAATASAHFEIIVPDSMVGDNQNRQSTGPCAGFTPSSSDEAVDFHVGGDSVAVFDSHPRSDWIIRGTLKADASGDWEQLYPIYRTMGEGRSCQPSVQAPEEWVGERGVIGLVGQADDGFLYGCAVVNFVAGTGGNHEACRNGSVNMAFVENDELTALATGSSSEASGSASPTASSDSDSEDNDDSAAATLHGGALASIVVSLAAVIGGAVMIL